MNKEIYVEFRVSRRRSIVVVVELAWKKYQSQEADLGQGISTARSGSELACTLHLALHSRCRVHTTRPGRNPTVVVATARAKDLVESWKQDIREKRTYTIQDVPFQRMARILRMLNDKEKVIYIRKLCLYLTNPFLSAIEPCKDSQRFDLLRLYSLFLRY